MKYELEIYAGINADLPDVAYSADEAFGGFSVGDIVHPVWRLRGEWALGYYPGDVLRVERVERIVSGRPSNVGRPDVAQLDKTLVYCTEKLGPRPSEEE